MDKHIEILTQILINIRDKNGVLQLNNKTRIMGYIREENYLGKAVMSYGILDSESKKRMVKDLIYDYLK